MRFGFRSSSALFGCVLSLGAAWGQRPIPQVGGNIAVTLSPSPVVFAETSPGQTSATITVTVKNPNTGPVTLGTASISGTNSGDFAITANNCPVSPSTLAGGTTCTITMQFAPATGTSANGTKTGTLSITNGSFNSTDSLSGQAGAATFSPAPLTFPATVIGQTSATQTTTLTNNSSAATTISSSAVASAGYTVTASTCAAGTQLAVGGTCTVTVAFAPTAIGTQTGTVSVTDDIGTQTVTLSGVGLMVNPAVTTFPAEAVGSTESATVTFNFGGPGTVSGFLVVTQGAPNLDFATGVQNDSTYCRTSGGPYATGSSCTATVTFKPITPGPVTGAVYLYDNETTPVLIGIGYLKGTGTGPMAALYPGTQTIPFANTAGDAFGLAVDLNGNVFYDNSNTGYVTKQTLSGATYTATTLGGGLGNFSNFAIDGAGYIFLTSSGITEETYAPQAGSYTQSTAISGVGTYATAIDGSNNLYVASGSTLYKETPSGGSYTPTTISTSFNNIIGLAVDSSNNLYVADAGNAALYELPYSGGAYAASPTTIAMGLGNANSVSIDAAGTVYTVANNNYTGVLRFAPASGGGFTALPVVGSFSRANGVVLDRHGNLYVTDDGSGNSVDEINVNGTESFTFSSTLVGATSALQTATLLNTGNTAMTVTGLTFFGPFSSTTTLSSCATLEPGATCTVPIAFTPTTIGAASGTLVFTDNTLGAAGTTQMVNLTGTGYENLIFTTAPPTDLQTGQNAGTVVVSVEKLGGTVDTTQNPPITLTVTGPNSYSQTYGPTTPVNGVVSFNTSANALTAVGTYSYSASTTTANFTATAPASEVISPYKLAISGITTPQTASNATTNPVTVSVLTNSGAATTQTNAITLTVTGPNSYTQTYGPAAASVSTGAVTFTTAALTATGTYIYAATSAASPDGVAVTAAPTVSQVITASAATTYTVTPANTTAVISYPDNITVKAYDTYGNLATNYAGTVMLSSTDPGPATLPAPFTLSSGTATQPVTFKTLTNTGWTVTATDMMNSLLTQTSVAIVVQPIPVYTINSSTGASDSSAACTNQALAGPPTGTTTDSDCNIYAAFSAVTALNNTATASYAPTINFVNGFASTLSNGTLTLATAVPVTGNFILAGPGAGANAITLSGGGTTTFLTQSSASSNMTLSGLTFTNFKYAGSHTGNGAVLVGGGSPGVVTFSNDVFSSNVEYGQTGGGVFYGSNLTVTGSTFTNNTGNAGGALYLLGGTNTISSSTFTSNSGGGGGGAIYAGGGTLTLSGNTYTSNTATNSGGNGGGAVYGTGTIIAEAGSTYTSNSTGYAGGAIGTVVSTGASLSIANSTFNTNHAGYQGGAVFAEGTLVITTGTTFTGNYALGNATAGGAVADSATAGTKTISGVSFINNYAKGSTATGGGLYLTVGGTVTNSLFSGNYVSATNSAYGGGAYSTGTYTGVTFYGNYTTGTATTQEGGAFYRVGAPSTMYNVTMTGNSAKVGGGSYASLTTYYNTVISGNTATNSYKDAFGTAAGVNYIDTSATSSCTTNCTPLLSALGNYGGPTQTMVPLPGSPLLAAGSLSYVAPPAGMLTGGATTDGRGAGYPRTVSYNGAAHTDIGAVTANYTLSFVTQPATTAVNAALLPPPTVQLYESGVPFTAGAGQTLVVAAQTGSMFTTAADSTPYSSVAITASGLESIAPFFSAPQSDDALTVCVTSSTCTTGTVLASTTSEPFSIGDTSAASIAFVVPPPATLTTGANAGVVKVALTSAGGATNTAVAATTVTIALAGTNYTATTVNGVATFNFATLNSGGPVVLPAGSYSYVASSSYTTDTVSAPETVGGDSVWALDASGSLVKLTTAGVLSATVANASGTANYGGVAFDNAGDVYSVNSAANSLLFATSTGGSYAAYTGGGLNAPSAVAVDGAGYVWIANSGNSTVSEFSDARAAMSPAAGYGAADGLSAPSAVVIDGTGGVWVANKTGNSVTHVFGAGTPVGTPVSSATAGGTLGAKP